MSRVEADITVFIQCDKVRPCAMCLRSESDCITSAVGETRT